MADRPADRGKPKWGDSLPCAMAGNFGFRGLIGLNGLDLFGSFWGNAKKNINKENKNWAADLFSSPFLFFTPDALSEPGKHQDANFAGHGSQPYGGLTGPRQPFSNFKRLKNGKRDLFSLLLMDRRKFHL